MYKDKANVRFSVVQKMVMALNSPCLLGWETAEEMCAKYLGRRQNEEAFPLDWARGGMTNDEKLQESRDRFLGTKRNYQLHVVHRRS